MTGSPVPALHGRSGCAGCICDTLHRLVSDREDVVAVEGYAGSMVGQTAHMSDGWAAEYEFERQPAAAEDRNTAAVPEVGGGLAAVVADTKARRGLR